MTLLRVCIKKVKVCTLLDFREVWGLVIQKSYPQYMELILMFIITILAQLVHKQFYYTRLKYKVDLIKAWSLLLTPRQRK